MTRSAFVLSRFLLSFGVASAGALGAAGCSAERGVHRSANVAAKLPLALPAPQARASDAPSGPGPSVGLESFAPLLSQPVFAAAAAALDADDPVRAARELSEALKTQPCAPLDVQPANYLLGRLREAAGDRAGARAAHEAAAAATTATAALTGYAHLGAARALLGSGHADAALERLALVTPGGPLGEEVQLATAEAAVLAKRPEVAIASLREYLVADHGKAEQAKDATLASLQLSELLAERTRSPALSFEERAALAREELTLARRAMARAPTDVDVAARARAVEMAALVLLPAAERVERARPALAEELLRLRTLLDGKQFEAGKQLADSILQLEGEKGRSSDIGCETDILRARALAGLKEWGHASEELGRVAVRCKDRDVRARALFLCGKYAESDKRSAAAIQAYEALERELPEHRLADDARLRAAETYLDMGAEGRFTELLTRMPDDYPGGDMVLDGMFSLARRRMEKGDWAAATSVLERAATLAIPLDGKRGQEFAGRERYFRARAWAVTDENATRSLLEYEAIVRELPLSYYMLHAYSRLAEADGARAARVLAEVKERASVATFAWGRIPEQDDAGFQRALSLLRASDIERARRELTAVGADKADARPSLLWAVALVYARAGAPKLSNDVARGLLTDWLVQWPAGEWSRAWEIAFPRPFHAIVEREAKKNGVPEHLVYAVMREESSFDPKAESPARAYGLMQLIVPTAAHFAKGLGIRADAEALKRPAINVGLGCRVLSDLTRSFSENPLLAIPGYNAGPGRPRRWLGDRPTVDFDMWVELIPFLETRRYMKRVLASRAAYAFLYAPSDGAAAMTLPIKLAAP